MSQEYIWIDRGTYWEFSAPQGDPAWVEVRFGRVTTAVSGAMGGRSRFKSEKEQGEIIAGIKEDNFTEDQISLMDHGTSTEPEARNWTRRYLKRNIIERGLIVPKWDPELGASIDGDVEGTDVIIEIKCPKKMYGPLEQYMDLKKYGKWIPPPNYYHHIWDTHYDQMQHAMAVTNKKRCLYVVYSTSDKRIFTQMIPFDQTYWDLHYKKIKNSYDKYVRPHLDGKYPILPTN